MDRVSPFFKVVNLSITLCCWIVFGGSSHCLYLLLFCCPPASTFECVSSIFMASPCRRLIFMQRKIMKGDEEGAINEKYPVLNEAASYLIGIFSSLFSCTCSSLHLPFSCQNVSFVCYECVRFIGPDFGQQFYSLKYLLLASQRSPWFSINNKQNLHHFDHFFSTWFSPLSNCSYLLLVVES